MTFLFWKKKLQPRLLVYINCLIRHGREQLPSLWGHFVSTDSLMDCEPQRSHRDWLSIRAICFLYYTFSSFSKKPKEFNNSCHQVLHLFIILCLMQSLLSKNLPLLLHCLDKVIWASVYNLLERKCSERPCHGKNERFGSSHGSCRVNIMHMHYSRALQLFSNKKIMYWFLVMLFCKLLTTKTIVSVLCNRARGQKTQANYLYLFLLTNH